MYKRLNGAQRAAVDQVLSAVDGQLGRRPNCFFIAGVGGTGKTFVYNVLAHTLKGRGESVLSVASTGIAATLLSGGRTAHSRFKLPVPTLKDSTSAVKANSLEGDEIRNAKLIIWDEASMAHSFMLETVDRLLKDLTKSDIPFGGKVIVFGGDVRQILPAVRRGTRAAIVATCIKQSELWPFFSMLRLTQNMRAGKGEQEFADWLLRLGNGEPSADEKEQVEIPESSLFGDGGFVGEIFGEIV